MPETPEPPGFAAAIERLGLLGGVVAGFCGLIVAIFCFFVPGLHFILGPFGPFLGGLVAGRLSGGGIARTLLAASLIAIGMATLVAAFTGLIFGAEVQGGLARAAPFIAFAYSGFFATIGAAVGGLLGGPAR